MALSSLAAKACVRLSLLPNERTAHTKLIALHPAWLLDAREQAEHAWLEDSSITSVFVTIAHLRARICAVFLHQQRQSCKRRQRIMSHANAALLGTFQGLALASDELNARSITHILLGFHRQHCTTHTLRIASGIPFKALRTVRRVQLLLSAPSRRSWHVSRSGVGVR